MGIGPVRQALLVAGWEFRHYFKWRDQALDDPNTSARTSLMFLPMLFIGLACFITLRDPDSTIARVFAVFPLTSAPALAVRAILTDVSPLEIAVSLALLVGTIWLVPAHL